MRGINTVLIFLATVFGSGLYLAIEQQSTEPKAAAAAPKTPVIAVHFAPGHECTKAIVAEINDAQKTIRVQAYNFTSGPIIDALIAAHDRGVDVELCLDSKATHQRGSGLNPCLAHDIPCWIDQKHPISHSKVMLIDGQTLITGSFNFSSHAEHNLENLLVIRDAKLVADYQKNWDEHRQHCRDALEPEKPQPVRPQPEKIQ